MIELTIRIKDTKGCATGEVVCRDKDVTPSEIELLKKTLPNLNKVEPGISSDAEKILADYLEEKE